jgi:hypothetical protein
VEAWEVAARESIRHTIASYTFLADHGRFDDVAELFAEDGALEVRGIGGAVAEGRAAIRDFFGGVGSDVVTTAPPGRMQHHVTSVRIDIESPEAASGFAYFTVMTGAGVDHWGRYRDRFALVGDRWLFAHRRVDTDGVTPGGWAASRRP